MGRLRVAFAANAAGVLCVLSAWAGSSVVLVDGQVIKGTDVRRDGDSYLVTMEGGSVVAFPAALVKEIKLEDDPAPAAPPGFDTSGPRNLAGPTLPPQNATNPSKDVMAGSRSTWAPNAVDTTWVPTSAYDPTKDVMAGSRSTWAPNAVDTTWVPTSAYDTSKDVMAGSKSTWSKSAIDTTWTPTDGFGFKPLSAKAGGAVTRYPLSFTAPAPIEVAEAPKSGPTPWACGESIFAKDHDAQAAGKRAPSISVRALKEPRYRALGLPLYVAETKVGTATERAVFTISGGQCRLLGGDADAILGLNLSPDHTMAQDAASFNAAMATRGGARVPMGVDPLDFALAFLSVTDPTISGTGGAKLEIVSKPEELKAIADRISASCPEGRSRKKKEARAANAAFALPRIVAGQEGDVATFLTWSSAGGTICRNTVVLSRDGVISAKREVLASHVGDHKD